MSTQFDGVKVLEQCQISPPSNSVPTTIIPLTFLDIPWFISCPLQKIFLYKVPFSADHFTDEVLPELKNSLSLTLQQFFPLCGNSVCPPPPSEPYILYNDGDSVPLFVAQSFCSFNDFLRDEPRDAKEIHPLVPPSLPVRVLDNTLEELTPLLAVQVTLFPNCGLCIGIKFHHVAADGMSYMHFMNTWASILQAKCDMSCVTTSLPIHDKGLVKDTDGFKDVILNQWRELGSLTWKEDAAITAALMEDNIRATFTLSRVEIEQLKNWVSAKCDNGVDSVASHYSSFVVTSAYIWVCLIKSLDAITTDSSKDEELCHFAVAADCRNKYGLNIPEMFFGNCIGGRFVSVSRSKFKQENCVATVAEAIRSVVLSFRDAPLSDNKHNLPKFKELSLRGENILSVVSSPKFAEYDVDFGWGRPARAEWVHIDISGAISLSESRHEKGGIEVGICRSRRQLESFTSFFHEGLSQFL